MQQQQHQAMAAPQLVLLQQLPVRAQQQLLLALQQQYCWR
jgi:hypothetical protein